MKLQVDRKAPPHPKAFYVYITSLIVFSGGVQMAWTYWVAK